MLYLIVSLSGAFLGAVVLIGTGLPVVALRLFQFLPLDRRLWWTLAAIFAVRCVRLIGIAENDYVVPTGGEKLAAFNALLLGGYVCVGLLWVLGIATLFWVGKKGGVEPVSLLTWPVAAIVLFIGLGLSVDDSEARRNELSDRRATVVAALKSGDVQAIKQLVADGEKLHQPIEELGNREPFPYAIEQEDIPMIKFFMNRPEPDRPKMKVWMSNMMATGNQEIIDILLDAEGQNPEFLGHALNVAVSSDAPEAFGRLLSMGADPNYMYNYTALMIAAKRNLQDIAVTLIEADANVDATHQSRWGKTNRTALSFAAEKGHIDIVRLLLKHDADPTIADEDGKRPVDWARSHDHKAIVNLLDSVSKTAGDQR